MPGAIKQPSPFRISLRELFVLVALVALTIVSLKYASATWLAVVVAVAMIAFFTAIIVATVDRGSRQAFAIGFALVMASYGTIVLNAPYVFGGDSSRTPEFDDGRGNLPTTRLMRYLHWAVEDGYWVEQSSRKRVNSFDPTKHIRPGAGSFSPTKTLITYVEIPSQPMLFATGHCWWALLLGYLGGWFARFVYLRRISEPPSLAAHSS